MLETITLSNRVISVGEFVFQNCTASIQYSYESSISSAWNGKTVALGFDKGDGTENNPYVIFDGPQYAYFVKSINEGNTYKDKYIILSSNILLNYHTIDTISNFEGTLDGRGYAIDKFSGIAIFDNLYGKIKNISFTKYHYNMLTTDVSNVGYAAPILKTYEGSTLENVFATGNLIIQGFRSSYVGGLVAYNKGNITNCYSSINVNASRTVTFAYAGGLVGYLESGLINSCFAAGNVTANGYTKAYSRNGGLIGDINNQSAEVINSFRLDTQILTLFDTTDSSYCEEGTIISIDELYNRLNWSSEWIFKSNKLPILAKNV